MASFPEIDVLDEIKRLSAEAAALLQLLADGRYEQEHDSSVAHYLSGIEHLLAHKDLSDNTTLTADTVQALSALLSSHQLLLETLVAHRDNLGSQLAEFHRKTTAIKNYAARPNSPVSITGRRKG